MHKTGKSLNKCFYNRNNIVDIKLLFFMIGVIFSFFSGTYVVSAAPINHPYLIFNDINETPGFQHRIEIPWKSMEASITKLATDYLSRNFSEPTWTTYDRISYRSEFAQTLGLAYQINKNTTYSEKTKEALLNIGIGSTPSKLDRALALRGYSLAYDWVQSDLDVSNDMIIRDKLAILADSVYKDLNDNGTNLNYISISDYHGQAYPIMGIAGLALNDYTNPNKLPLSSTPSDWVKAGTEYLFVNDKLHNYNRSLFSFGFDPSGKYYNGNYKTYVLDDFLWWFQVYSHFYGKNIFDEYPLAKKAFTSEIWESMPNHYQNNYVTYGNTKQYYHKGILNLLDPENKSYALNHIDITENSKLLPYSSAQGLLSNIFLYLVYDNNSLSPRKNPVWTSHLDPNSIYQVFRGSWAEDSDWLSLITFNGNTKSNRDMAHHDQMSFEYYSRGDLLLADGGEHKHILGEIDYSEYEIYHNGVAIEDPRIPFSSSSWANSIARGIFKGNAAGLNTPVHIDDVIQTPWMELLETHSSLTKVIGSSWNIKKDLSSPIQYERDVIFPNKEYFIVIDRLKGTQTWTYRNIFRPTSLNITPSLGINASDVGHVNEDLYINNTPYDWLSLPYKNEIATGINTNSIKWKTTNPYGNNVEMHLFSVPSSEIKIIKHVGRIAGYDTKSEVYTPVLYFVNGPLNEIYRVTVFLSRYSSETEKIPQQIPVNGNGNTVKITSAMYEDYAYSGTGQSSFAQFSTDAETLYVRKTTKPSEYTLINGTYINYSGMPLVSLSKKIDYFTLKEEKNKTYFKLKGSGTVNITLYNMNSDIYQVKKDGNKYSTWVLSNNNITLTTDLTEHDFEIISASNSSYSNSDVNLDGYIDIMDLIFTSQFFNKDTNPPYPVYDVNMDGKSNILDLVLISKDIIS